MNWENGLVNIVSMGFSTSKTHESTGLIHSAARTRISCDHNYDLEWSWRTLLKPFEPLHCTMAVVALVWGARHHLFCIFIAQRYHLFLNQFRRRLTINRVALFLFLCLFLWSLFLLDCNSVHLLSRPTQSSLMLQSWTPAAWRVVCDLHFITSWYSPDPNGVKSDLEFVTLSLGFHQTDWIINDLY